MFSHHSTRKRFHGDRLFPSGRGEYFPKAQNDTPENRALNRRTEIIVAPKLGEIFKAISSFE
ncbi:MAG: hypothetical protein JW913_03110 [Chitinispirillaceae bacterium]|nr:hypothetical protein [Chitinispirillaceae bacterium]